MSLWPRLFHDAISLPMIPMMVSPYQRHRMIPPATVDVIPLPTLSRCQRHPPDTALLPPPMLFCCRLRCYSAATATAIPLLTLPPAAANAIPLPPLFPCRRRYPASADAIPLPPKLPPAAADAIPLPPIPRFRRRYPLLPPPMLFPCRRYPASADTTLFRSN